MKILAFDTTNSTLSVALFENKKILAKTTIYESGKQSEILIPEIEKILHKNHIWYEDLNFIAHTSGPGSFTGVRIGISTARTLKIATNLPLISLDSLEVLAFKYCCQKSEEIFVAIDARMDEFFIGSFVSDNKKLKQVTKSQLIKSENIIDFLPKKKFFLCGSGKKIISEILLKNNLEFENNLEEDVIEADLVGLLAYEKICEDAKFKEFSEAIYLRDPRISQRKNSETK